MVQSGQVHDYVVFLWFACVGFYALSRVFQLFNDDSSQIHFLWTIYNQYLNSPLYWHWRDNRSAIPIILFLMTLVCRCRG